MPNSESRNSNHETRNPKPETRNPNPETRNPERQVALRDATVESVLLAADRCEVGDTLHPCITQL